MKDFEHYKLMFVNKTALSMEHIEDIQSAGNFLIETIEQQQTTQDILLEQIKQNTLKIKEMKKNSRLILFYQLAEENLKLAEENARLKA